MVAATALYAGVQAFVFLSPWPAGTQNDPASAKIALFLLSNPMYVLVLLICVLCLIAGRRQRRSGGRPPRRPAPGAAGQVFRYPLSAGRAESVRRLAAVTSTRPKPSGAILRGGLVVTAAVAPSRVACRNGWCLQSGCRSARSGRPAPPRGAQIRGTDFAGDVTLAAAVGVQVPRLRCAGVATGLQ